MTSAPRVDRGFAGNLRFSVLRRLGGGAGGEVYEAVDHERNTRVALKTLPRSSDGAALMRLKREFRALTDLGHANLVALGELFCEEQEWFFSMELVEGVDFVSWVRPRGVLHERRLRDGLAQLALGLAALHGAGRIHRDIKPSNVLVSGARVVLLDSGVLGEAPSARPNESDPRVVGSVDYMAPEQAAAQAVTAAADWYSVGTMLYEALAGVRPFSGPPLEVVRKKRTETPPPPPGPADLSELAMALLGTRADDRPSGVAVARQLDVESAGDAGPVDEAPFVGRAAERAVLAAAFEDVRRGEAVTLLVGGEPGVGKTALVRAFTDGLPGAVVLFGRAHEREAVPYKGLDGIIDAAARFLMRVPAAEVAALLPQQAALLAEVFPVLRRVESFAQAPLPRGPAPSLQERRVRVFAALRELFARLAAWRPLVLVVDDLHWADVDSLAVLGGLLAPPDPPAILFVGTARHDTATLAATLGGARELPLPRLAPDESQALAERLLAMAGVLNDGQQAAAVAREAGGHPRFLEELVRHVAAGGAAELVRLDEALGARIGALGRETQHVLELLAVAGAPLSQETLAAAAGIDFAELGRVLAQLRSAALALTYGARRTDTVEPYHERVRDAVLARLDAHAQRRAHERLALALEAAPGSDAERLSIHWQGAGDNERAALRAAQAAVRAGEQLAFDRAALLYRRAIELRPIDAAAHQAQLAAVLAQAGRGPDAAQAFLAAAAGAERARAAELTARAAEQLLCAGRVDDGLKAAAPILAALGLAFADDAAGAARILRRVRWRLFFRGRRTRPRDATEVAPAVLRRLDVAWALGSALLLVEPMRGLALLAQHGRLALDAGEPERLARACSLDAVIAAAHGDAGGAAKLIAAADQLAARLATPEVALVTLALGAVPFFLAHFDDAADRLGAAITQLRERGGQPWALDVAHILRLLALQAAGRLRLAAETALPALRDAVDRGDLFAAASLRAGLHRVHLAAGDVARVRADVDEVRRQLPSRFTVQHWLALYAETEAHIYAGAPDRAVDVVTAAMAPLAASGLRRSPLIDAATLELEARAALAAGRTDGAAAIARKLAAHRSRSTTALVGLLEAGIAAQAGDATRADERLTVAERDASAAGLRLHAAAAHAFLGLRAGGGERVEASYGVLRHEQVREPLRFLTLLAPGFRA